MSLPPDPRRALGDDGIVCCAIGHDQYALRGADVRHIVRGEGLKRRAGPDGSIGVLDVGGRTVPVFDLGRIFDHAPAGAGATGHHIAVTGDRDRLVGWLADRIVRTPQAQVTDVAPLPPIIGGRAARWFDALVKIGDSSVLLLSPRDLVPGAEGPVAPDPVRPFVARGPAVEGAEPMVLVFASPALPKSASSRYALSARRIVAVVKTMPAMRIPGSAPHVTGIAWWRNGVVPVVDFRAAADRLAAPAPRFVVAQCGEPLRDTLVAIPIDADVTLHRASAGQPPVTAVPRQGFVVGMYEIDGRPVALLDLDGLLAPELSASGKLSA